MSMRVDQLSSATSWCKYVFSTEYAENSDEILEPPIPFGEILKIEISKNLRDQLGCLLKVVSCSSLEVGHAVGKRSFSACEWSVVAHSERSVFTHSL